QRMRHVTSLTLGCVPFDAPRHAGYQALFGRLRELIFLRGIEYERSSGRSFWISSAPLDLPALSRQAFPLLEQCVESTKHRRTLLQDLHTERPFLLLLFDPEATFHDFELTSPSVITWLADRNLAEMVVTAACLTGTSFIAGSRSLQPYCSLRVLTLSNSVITLRAVASLPCLEQLDLQLVVLDLAGDDTKSATELAIEQF